MKKLIETYSFDASERKVTLTNYNPIVLDRLLMITNVTDNIIIYVFNDPAKGATVATNVVTLTYDTTSMDDADKLQIFYDDVPATGTTTSVASSATNVTLLAANASRFGAMIFNDSTAILYVKFGATASATSYTVKMDAGDYFEVPYEFVGQIDGIWASANGYARVTEVT